MISFKISKRCRLCNHKKLFKILDLPPTIPGEQLKKNKFEINTNLIPIDFYLCSKCKHVQLIHVPNFKDLWGKDYTFKPSDNPVLIKHFTKTINYFIKNHKKNIFKAFEVGSNDGIFLKILKEKTNCKILGIDPSDEPVNLAKKNKIPTIKKYFDFKVSKDIKKQHGKFDLVIANNVFAHMHDMQSITKGISNLLEVNGYFIFEASYLIDVMNKFLIGTIIHEHISIHSVTALYPFLKKFELNLIDLIHVKDIQGGALIGIAKKSRFNKKTEKLEKFLQFEKRFGLNKINGFVNYQNKFNKKINQFSKKINKYIDSGTLVGYGAARSAPLIIDIFSLKNKIKYIIDDNPRKVGKYIHTNNIPIKPYESVKKEINKKIIFIFGCAQTKRILDFLEKKHKKLIVITIFPKFEIIKIN